MCVSFREKPLVQSKCFVRTKCCINSHYALTGVLKRCMAVSWVGCVCVQSSCHCWYLYSCHICIYVHKSYRADIFQVTVSWVQRKLSQTRKTSTKETPHYAPESRVTSWGKGDRRGRKINPMYSQFVKVGKPTRRSHKGTHQNSLKQTSFPQTETGEG